MKKSGQLQISFGWMFAIIVGIFILFLAIYGAARLLDVGETASDARVASEIGILLNPLETNFESGVKTSMVLPTDTRIINRCNNQSVFGRQTIRVSQRSFNQWTETGIDAGFSNKYIFSANYSEGRRFNIFSKPLDFPFKVADLIFLTSVDEKYCFVDSPEHIGREIQNLNLENFEIFEEDECSDNSRKICFDSVESCEINVKTSQGTVEKNNEIVYFHDDALMYAAILSDKEIYECQIQRLMKRANQLSLVYFDKASIVSRTSCNSGLGSDLLVLSNDANNLANSGELNLIADTAEKIGENNQNANCRLW
jgi:hypothetical protein